LAAGTETRPRFFLALTALVLIGVTVGRSFGQSPEPPPTPSAQTPTPRTETPQGGTANVAGATHVDQGKQIASDLSSKDPAVRDKALEILRLTVITDPKSDKAKAKATRWCRHYLEKNWLKPLLALKEYDLIQDLVTVGLVYEQDDTAGVDSIQHCLVETLLDSGKYDDALIAAKSYYNVCLLENSGAASDLIVEALANSRTKQDPSVVRRFKLQQLAGAQPPAGDAPASQPADAEGDVLKSIVVDASPYQAQLDDFDLAPKNFKNFSAHANMLLLADQPAEARQQFELALDLADEPAQMSAAVANVARAIRAKDGVGAANAYIISLRQGNTQTP
jgi:hypothetical protein